MYTFPITFTGSRADELAKKFYEYFWFNPEASCARWFIEDFDMVFEDALPAEDGWTVILNPDNKNPDGKKAQPPVNANSVFELRFEGSRADEMRGRIVGAFWDGGWDQEIESIVLEPMGLHSEYMKSSNEEMMGAIIDTDNEFDFSS